jgi:hypothetical protein
MITRTLSLNVTQWNTSMDGIDTKLNPRTMDNQVTWILCMSTLQALNEHSYFRYLLCFASRAAN